MLYSLHDVFISYRRFEDKEKTNDLGTRLAGAIYRFLTKKGLRVFWDDPEMEPGDFEEQLHWQIEHSPNYIFIGTEAAKRFRPDVKDFVAEEVGLALELYHASPNKDRVAIHILPMMSDMDREKAAEAGPYPGNIQKLMKLHGVELHGELPTEKDLSDILKHVTRVNRGNMWNAGHHWFEQSREAGHRFASLNINKSIMPNANIHRQEDIRLPIRAHGDGQADLPLLEMIEKTTGQLYLIGEGGIGKTTALYSIMEDVYGGDLPTGSMEQLRLHGQVPLFVELSRAPDTYGKLYEGGKSTFIHRAVYQQLRQDLSAKQVPGSAVRQLDEVFEIDPETAVNPIHDLFTQQSPAPEYLLLLDGLNEVSRVVIEHREEPEMKSAVVTMILQEIHQLMTECPNVRVILTSRSKEQTNWGDETTLLYLSGVNDDSVKDYLVKAHVSQASIESAMNNEKLRDVLRVPLFLTLYAALDGDEELLTQGEILHLFFHQKKKALYSTRTRIDQVDADVDKAASAKQFRRLTATMQGFILDFILPEIAWRMEQNDMFHIYRIGDEDEVNLSTIIEHVLTDESDTAVCGRYAEAFEEYLSDSDAAQDTLAIAEDMIERLGGRMRRVVDSILNCAVMTLGILQKNGDEYGFIHHHIRDYFAAVYQINQLKLAVYLHKRKKNELARECLSDWKAAPLHAEVRRFIGEALGEAHNAPVCDDEGNWHYVVPEEPCGRNLIKRGLDIYRGRFDGEDGYAVWNLLEVLKKVRYNLSGEDFSCLDLTCCDINGYPLGVHSLSAIFERAKLNKNFLLPRGHLGPVTSVSFSLDDKHVLTTSWDNTIRIWDISTMQEIGVIKGHNNWVTDAVFSNNGKYIISTSYDHTVRIWDLHTLEEIKILKGHTDYVNSIVSSPDGNTILTTSNDNTARIWSTDASYTARVIKGHTDRVTSAAFSPKGETIASGSSDCTIRLWSVSTLTEIGAIRGHKGGVNSVVFSPCGKYVLSTSDDCTARIWNTDSLQEVGVLVGHTDIVVTAHYSHDGRFILTGSWDHTICVWDAKTFELIRVLKDHKEPISCVRFDHRGTCFVSASMDCSVAVWDLNTMSKIDCIKGHTAWYKHSMFNNKGDLMLAVPFGNSIQIWDIKGLRCIGILGGWTGLIKSVQYSPDSKHVSAVFIDSTIVIWSVEQYKVDRVFQIGEQADIVVYSPDGKYIAFTCLDNSIYIMDSRSLSILGKLCGHTGRINSAVFRRDGQLLVTTSNDQTVRLWNTATMKEVGAYLGEDKACSCFFTRDGNSIIISCEKGKIVSIDVKSMKKYKTINIDDNIVSIENSPNGRYVLGVSDIGFSTIWDMETWNEIATLSGHTKKVSSASFNSDGSLITTSSNDGKIKIWDAETFECLHTIHNIPGLEVIGVDLRHLHPDSRLSDEVKERLYEYGAIIDERG